MAKFETRAEETRAPKSYTVLVSFTDGEDKAAPTGANVYWAGKDTYPREGHTPTEERIAFLQSNKTALKQPVLSGAK